MRLRQVTSPAFGKVCAYKDTQRRYSMQKFVFFLILAVMFYEVVKSVAPDAAVAILRFIGLA